MPTTDSLNTEQRIGIRAAYITGHFDLDEALIRIQNGGFTQLTREQAVEVLTMPMGVKTVKQWTGKDVTLEQIKDRLAEVA